MATEMEEQMSVQDTDFQLTVTEHFPPNPNRATVSRTDRVREFAQQEPNNNPAMGNELVATAQF